jgi:uncharacterized membrane protein YkvA (DUF1232 family)
MAPRFLPGIVLYIRLVWRLIFDKRVNIVLRALVPLAVLYVISPIDLFSDFRAPLVARSDDLIILGLAILILIKLAPRHVVDELMGRPRVSNRPEDKDPSKVVDGSSKLIDEE